MLPSVSTNFSLPSTSWIPLLCTCHELDLQDTYDYSGYSALPYKLGQRDPSQSIKLQGRAITIRQNLWCSLIQARKNCMTKCLWINIFSINPESYSIQAGRGNALSIKNEDFIFNASFKPYFCHPRSCLESNAIVFLPLDAPYLDPIHFRLKSTLGPTGVDLFIQGKSFLC